MMPSPRLLRLALLQSHCSPQPTDNLRRFLALAEKAARQNAQVICTPELFLSPYFCQSEDHRHFQLAETIPGPTTRAFQKLARRRAVVLVASLFERRAPGLYHNSAAIIDADGTLLGVYRKMHIPDDPGYYEKFYFTPGDLGFRTWPTRHGRLGVLICWDQWFPEAARLTALQGADLLLYPTAIGWLPAEKKPLGHQQHEAWQLAQRAHAVANGCFVAAVNRVGLEHAPPNPGIEFWGQSFVCHPSGQLLAQASPAREEILFAELNLDQIDAARTHWPFLRDRRIDAYHDLTRRFLDAPPARHP